MWFPRWHLCCQILLYHHDLQEGWCKRCLVLKAEETLWLHVIGTEPVNIRCMHLMHPVGSCVTDQPGQIKDKSKIRIWWYSKENCNDYGHKSHGTNEEVTKGGPMWYWGTNGCGFTQLCTYGIFVLSKVLLNYAPGLCIWLSMVLTDNMLWPILFCYSAMLF